MTAIVSPVHPVPSAEWNTLTGSDDDRRRAILQRKIDQGRATAQQLLESVERDQPRDQIVRAGAIGFEPDRCHGIQIRVGDDACVPTEFAIGRSDGFRGRQALVLRGANSACFEPRATWRGEPEIPALPSGRS